MLGGILEKCKETRMTPELRELAMFVCLIYSSATPDRVCISTTINLFVGGYTSWKKFAEASAEELKEFTQEAGIDARNDRLIDIAKDIVENHGGRLPSERSVMEEWVGVKGKTASILCNEVHHIPSGIGVDRHVRELSTALGYYIYPTNKRSVVADPHDVECSLLTWVPRSIAADFNRIIGSTTQLFTQSLAFDDSRVSPKLYNTLAVAIASHVYKPYHVQIVFFVVSRARKHYRKLSEKAPERLVQ